MTESSHLTDSQHLLDQNRLLTEEIQRRVNQLAAINTVAATVSQSLDLDTTLRTALEAVLGIIPVEAAAISLIEAGSGDLVLRAQCGLNMDFVSSPMRIPRGEGMSGIAVAENRVVIINDHIDPRQLAVPDFLKEQIKAMILAPMHAGGQVIGVLSVMSHVPYPFSPAEVDVLTAIADQVGVALDNARLYEETRHHEEQLWAIVHSVTDAIIATDAGSHITVINEAARVLFDLRSEHVLGMTLDDSPLEPDLKEHLRQAMQRDNHDDAVLFELTMEIGRTFTVVVSRLHSPSQMDHHDIDNGWVITLRDITYLKEKENARMRFVQSAAHDLRNPLSVTLSALVMLGECIQDDPEAEEIAGIALDAVNRMQALLDDMLHLERIKSGVSVELSPTDVPSLLQNTIRDMRPNFEQRQQSLVLDMPDALPQVLSAPQWLQRAIANYLSNACKYTQEGGEIVLFARQREDELLIEVRDNGPGIPPEAQGRLFERFYRVPSNFSKASGTGLGLAIVKSVAESHSGRVYMRSKPGEGSTFGLALPVMR